MPTAPGGATDTAGRVLAESMSATLGRQVVVDNRPGASTTLGARLVAQSPPDGYTVLFGVAANLALVPQLAPSGYDPLTAFTAIGLIQRGPYVLSITRRLEIADVKQLIDYARANPGKLAYATPGVGSAQHLAWEMLASRTGTRFLHVPGGKMLIDTIAGRIPLLLDSPSPTLIQSAEAGKLRFIALSGARRLEQLPHVPTFIEQGLAGFEAYSWWGLVAPANTPGSAIAKLNAALTPPLNRGTLRNDLLRLVCPTSASRLRLPNSMNG